MPKALTERRDRTFVISINRPEVRNCVDGDTAGPSSKPWSPSSADDALDVLILTGSGTDAFCSGADLKNIGTLGARAGARDSGPMGISRITDVGKPTIAAVEGYCTAGGLELACWCDFRIASENAQFGVLNRRWGVPLVDGGTQRLPRIVGLGNALYLIETGALLNARQAFGDGPRPGSRAAEARRSNARWRLPQLCRPTRKARSATTAAPRTTASRCRSTRGSRTRPPSTARPQTTQRWRLGSRASRRANGRSRSARPNDSRASRSGF